MLVLPTKTFYRQVLSGPLDGTDSLPGLPSGMWVSGAFPVSVRWSPTHCTFLLAVSSFVLHRRSPDFRVDPGTGNVPRTAPVSPRLWPRETGRVGPLSCPPTTLDGSLPSKPVGVRAVRCGAEGSSCSGVEVECDVRETRVWKSEGCAVSPCAWCPSSSFRSPPVSGRVPKSRRPGTPLPLTTTATG